MKRINLMRVLALLATLALTQSSAVQAQNAAINSRAGKQASAQTATRTYSPRITGRSNSMIVEGRITEIRDDFISIKTARGTRYDFRIDDQTTTLNSDELISIATMSDITLNASDLRTADLIEVVAERAGRRATARIITRIASQGDHIASR
jgi:hypothetical protein